MYVKYPVETKYLLTLIQNYERYTDDEDRRWREEVTVEPFLKQKLDIESIAMFDNISTDPVVVVAD